MNHSIDQHMERHLGPIARGWAPADMQTGVQICLFEDSPARGVVTYATLGLSRHVLDMPQGRKVRLELLLSVAGRFIDEDLPKLLAYVAEGILREHQAPLRGQVLPLHHQVSKVSQCTSLYVAPPVVFPAGLATCSDTQPPTVFAWLIPIPPAEVGLVHRFGWNDFEDRLERANVNLFDLEREPFV